MWPPVIISDLYTVAVFFTNLLLLKFALLSRRETRTEPITTTRQFVDDTCPSARWVGPPSEEECSVCLSDFVAGEDVRELGCKHSFHKGCVDTWLFRDDRKWVVVSCPLCRRNVVPAAAAAGGGDEGDWGSRQFAMLLLKLRGDDNNN
ncbi:E3 ubiquitin-protein ligase RNF6 [Linum perenne]